MAGSLDLGVTPGQVEDLLRSSPVVSIVGYQRSGKSKLAETLDQYLRGQCTVILQAASTWSQRQLAQGGHSGDASVDPEIVHVLEQADRTSGKSCWIVDDAEVMLAYATDTVLARLRERLRAGNFSLVMVRNRFVLEGEGWFQQRQSALAHDIPTLTMRPMRDEAAIQAATDMFYGPSRILQGEWLASMSGGVPGLMADLYRYTPLWPPQSPDTALLAYAQRRREELELDRPVRRLLIEALLEDVLPPPALLSEQARNEVGVLLLSGMVASDYATGADAFNGRFWRWLCAPEEEDRRRAIEPSIRTAAMTLELMIGETEMSAAVRHACGVAVAETGALSRAIERSLHCERHFPSLVKPLRSVLGEALGRYGLLQILRAHDFAPHPGATPDDLLSALFTIAQE